MKDKEIELPKHAYLTYPTSFTPEVFGFGTITDIVGSWCRIGNSMKVYIRVTSGTVTAIPAYIKVPNNHLIAENQELYESF